MGLHYAVGVTSAVVVWPPGVEPLPPETYSGKGRPPVTPRRTAQLQPMSVKALALSLPAQAFQTISWREGTNAPLTGRFAAVRVRHAGGNAGKASLRPQEWLLIEWPVEQAEPVKYILSTLPECTPFLGKPVSSMIHQPPRLKSMCGTTHWQTRRRTSTSDHWALATK